MDSLQQIVLNIELLIQRLITEKFIYKEKRVNNFPDFLKGGSSCIYIFEKDNLLITIEERQGEFPGYLNSVQFSAVYRHNHEVNLYSIAREHVLSGAWSGHIEQDEEQYNSEYHKFESFRTRLVLHCSRIKTKTKVLDIARELLNLQPVPGKVLIYDYPHDRFDSIITGLV
jgi:hypothetical protein